MSGAKHTAGNWEVAPGFEPGEDISIEVQGAPIAVVYGTDSFPCLDDEYHDIDAINAENLATARVMAAAPDLLAACELWDKGFADGEEFTPEQLLKWLNDNRRVARAAIAKAKGETE
jgi:hypothetical protein